MLAVRYPDRVPLNSENISLNIMGVDFLYPIIAPGRIENIFHIGLPKILDKFFI